MAARNKLQHPEKWKTTKYITWPPSWKTPMVRVPEKDGGYRSFSVKPRKGETEIALLARCRLLRDSVGIPIWGEEKWWNILRFPARSSTKPKRGSKTPYNGVSLVERPGWASYYAASWYEVDPSHDPTKESQTHGKRVSRKKRRKTFSFGTKNAKYDSSEAALQAAIEFVESKQEEVYVLVSQRTCQHMNDT